MRTIQALDSTSLAAEFVLLVSGEVAINSNWGEAVTGKMFVGAGITAYVFAVLSELTDYASSNGLALPSDEEF
jgi:hypothetical protein